MDVDALLERMDAVRQDVAILREKISDPYLLYELQATIWKLEELDAVCFRCGPDGQAPYLNQADRMLFAVIDHVQHICNAAFGTSENAGSSITGRQKAQVVAK